MKMMMSTSEPPSLLIDDKVGANKDNLSIFFTDSGNYVAFNLSINTAFTQSAKRVQFFETGKSQAQWLCL